MNIHKLLPYLLFIVFLVLLFGIYKMNQSEAFNINPNGINSFDKIMYINLSHRKDRNKQILNEFKKVDIPNNKIIRIEAVHNKLNGHIGCAKSHIKALELAKKMNLKNVIIFEDDFIFTFPKKVINDKINHFLTHFKGNWDVIQLTTVYKSLDTINNVKYIKKVNSASTSSAYIIQSHFYNNLLNVLNESVVKMEKEMEVWLTNNPNKKKKYTSYALDQYWNPLQKKSKWYIFDPYLGKQGGDAGSSSIMGGIESFENKSSRITLVKMYM